MKLFVLIRDDLESIECRAVQAGHAVGLFKENHYHVWKANDYLIYVRVKDLDKLTFWEHKIRQRGYKHSVFEEPDLKYEKTALAVAANNDDSFFTKLHRFE